MSARLAAAIARARAQGRCALSAYLPAGFPSPAQTPALLDAAVAGGADWIEVGLPFSDPVADGPVLQAASSAALAAGATFGTALEALRDFRVRHPEVPVVAMTYANVLHRHGWDGAAAALADAGADGLIVPDVPLEESAPLRTAAERHGLAFVPLVSPTTPDDRMAAIAATATPTGFLYAVANVGVTGQADPGRLMAHTVRRARAARRGSDLAVAVGFGIRTAADVARARQAGADAAIVGSQLIPALRSGPGALRDEVASLRAGCIEPSKAPVQA